MKRKENKESASKKKEKRKKTRPRDKAAVEKELELLKKETIRTLRTLEEKRASTSTKPPAPSMRLDIKGKRLPTEKEKQDAYDEAVSKGRMVICIDTDAIDAAAKKRAEQEALQKAEEEARVAAEEAAAAAKLAAEEEARLKAEQDAAAARKIAEENAAAAKKKAEEEAAARQSVASSPVLPVWNSGFELDDVTAQPRGWSVYAVNPSTGPTVTTVESPGHLKVSGKRNFGIYHGVDLKDFIGETLEFSADMRTTISGFLEAWGRKEVRTMADSKTPGWQRVSIKFPVIAGDTFQKLYIGSLSEGELEVKDLRLIRASESKPVLPTWNSRFELDGGTAQPRSWNVYAVNSSTGPTSITFMEEGYVRISGRRNFGVYTAPLDLSSFVGKKIRFSALIKAPISGFIEFWGKHERDRTNFLPSNEWQSVFVETVIEAGSTSQKLYIGSLGDGAVDVKDLHLEEVPE